MKKTFVLFNPKANNETEESIISKVKSIITDQELEFINVLGINNYQELINTFDSSNNILLCGGDGTINRFINEIDLEKIKNEIYYLPTGTGNDFYNDVKEENEGLVHLNKYLHHIPECDINGKHYKFINGIGYGIDGYCCEKGDEIRAKGNKKVNYTSIAISGLLFHYKPTNATVIIDGKEYYFKKVWIAPVMKGRCYGGGMIPTPNQNRTGDKLSFMVFYGSNKLKTLMIFPGIFKGEHIKQKKYIQIMEGSDITVKFDSPRSAQVDGETILNVKEFHAYCK